jgi:hypothetical protein
MNDDWRLQIDFREDGYADALVDRLDARELEGDLSEAFHDRVIVTRNEATVFLYAGDREQAERARKLVESFAQREQEELDVDFTRWHPLAAEWKPADEPLPADAAAQLAEHEARIAGERKEVEDQGYPEYEVRVDLPSHGAAEEFADRLREEGLPTVHRWKYVIVGASDEDQAKALAERIRGEAPAGSAVAVQGTWRDIYKDRLPNPFAFLGGLAG